MIKTIRLVSLQELFGTYLLTYNVFWMIDAVDIDKMHASIKQNVPIRNAEHTTKKNISGELVYRYTLVMLILAKITHMAAKI